MTGQRRRAFRNAGLAGSWNSWADIPMAEIVAEDGCLAFAATVSFDDGQAGQRVWWGVRLDGPAGANAWGIMTDDQQRQQELQLPGPGASAEAHYYLTWSRRLGAQKHYPGSAAPDLRFAVWAPNALNVEVCSRPPPAISPTTKIGRTAIGRGCRCGGGPAASGKAIREWTSPQTWAGHICSGSRTPRAKPST